MKILKRIVFWIMISLLLQFCMFFYLDRYYLKPVSTFKDTIIPVSAVSNKNADLKIPDSALNIKAAYDGKYIAYTDGNTLKVLNTQSGQVRSVQFDTGVELSYYRWFPDADLLIFAEKHSGTNYDILKFSTYDPKKNERTVFYDKSTNSDVAIQLPDNKSEVTDIELSTLTNMIYVKIQQAGSRNSLYSINVMGEYERISLNSYFIGDMALIPHEANGLLYEDTVYNKVYQVGQWNPVNISGVPGLGVLGVDDNDNVYLGNITGSKLKGFKISKIYYGRPSDPASKWQIIDLKGSFTKQDIFITLSGRVFINDSAAGVVKEVKTGIETSYKGKFITMFSEETDYGSSITNTGIVSSDNGNLYIEQVK